LSIKREETGVSVPIEILYEAQTDISVLSLYIRMNSFQSKEIDLLKECILDPSIVISPTLISPTEGSVLLTGCTGFLGAFLLYPKK
jgi:hypothetical protein